MLSNKAHGQKEVRGDSLTTVRVLRKHHKHGDVLVCGFPVNQLDTVLQRIREALSTAPAASSLSGWLYIPL